MGIIINGQNDTIGPVDDDMTLLGTVSIGGTMTIEDFTNIDSVGLGTFRNGLHVTGGNVAVGHNNPQYSLDLGESSSTIRLVSENNGTAIRVGAGGNNDVTLLRVDGNNPGAIHGESDSANYGFSLKYMGSRNGNNNSLSIFSDNQVGTQVESVTIFQDGKIGINETSPDTYLHVKTGTDSALAKLEQTATNGRVQVQYLSPHGDWLQGIVGASNTGDYLIYTGQSKNLTFYTSGALRQKIQGDGKVIIGGNANQTANRDLSVVAASGNSNEAQIGLQPTNSSGGYNPEVFISAIADGAYGAHMYFKTRDTSGNRLERLRITSAGKIGIGVGSPDQMLEITNTASTGSQIQLRDTSTATGDGRGVRFGYNGSGAQIWNFENTYIRFATNNAERLRIASDGKVHIGGNGTGTDQLNVIAAGGGINISRLNSGSPSVNEWLGAVGFKGYATGNSSSGADARIHANAAFNHSGTSAPANLIFSTKPTTTGPGSAPTERMRISYDGNLGIGCDNPQYQIDLSDSSLDHLFTGAINAEQDGGDYALKLTALGKSGGRTGSVRFITGMSSPGSEVARFTTTGLTFNGDTAAANALDDYEEGSWTPVVTSNSTHPTYSVTNNYSYYIKIGRLVHFNVDFYATISSVGSGGSIYISMPFAEDNTSSNKMEQYVGGMGGRAQSAFNLSRQEIGWYYANGVMYMRHQNKDTYDESGAIGTADLRTGQVRFNLDGWFYAAS